MNLVTLVNIRGNPFYSKLEEYSIWNPFNDIYTLKFSQNKEEKNWDLFIRYASVKRCMALVPIIFMQSAMCCLRHTYSINLVCEKTEDEVTDADLKLFCQENGQYLNTWQIFHHNFWNWTLFFFIGVNFTHFDYLPQMNHFTFSSEEMPSWPWWFFLMTGTFLV